MNVLNRSEYCRPEKAQPKSVELGGIFHKTVFRGRVGKDSGIWFKAYCGAVLIVPDGNGLPVCHGSSGDLDVVDYEVLDVTLVVEDK